VDLTHLRYLHLLFLKAIQDQQDHKVLLDQQDPQAQQDQQGQMAQTVLMVATEMRQGLERLLLRQDQ